MKNRGKRFIVLLLSVLMVVSQMSFIAFATEPVADDQTGNDPVESAQPADVENDGEDGEEVVKDEEPSDPAEAEGPVTTEPEDGEEAAEPEKIGKTPAKLAQNRNTIGLQSIASEAHEFTIKNETAKTVRLNGEMVDSRADYVYELKPNEQQTFNLRSIKSIESVEVIRLTGQVPASTEWTKRGDYKYVLEFTDATVHDAVSFNVVKNTERALISFDSNGIETQMNPQIVSVGTDTALTKVPGNFSRNNFTFLGWAKEKTAIKEDYSDGGTIRVEGDTTLYAVWSPDAKEIKTPATAASELEYTDQPQSLLDSGAAIAEGATGTIKYWRKDHPGSTYEDFSDVKGTNAGDYDVCYAVFKGNTQQSKTLEVTCHIAPKPVAVEWSNTEFIYNGAWQGPSAKVDVEGLQIEVTGKQVNASVTNEKYRAHTAKATIKNGNGNYELTNDTCKFWIFAKTVEIKWNGPAGFKYAYNGTGKSPTAEVVSGTVGTDSCGIADYVIFNEDYDEVDEAVDAGEYEVLAITDNLNYTAFNYADTYMHDEEFDWQEQYFEITKAAGVYNSPTAKTDLVYTGKPQELINPGSTDYGTMLYSLDDENYSDKIPTGTNAGSYTVHVKYVGDKNHRDEKGSLPVKIAQADFEPTLLMDDWTYGTTPSEPRVEGNIGGADVEYSYYGHTNAPNNNTYGPTETRPSEAGSYWVYATIAEGDYVGKELRENFIINRADLQVDRKPVARNLTYTGQAQDLIMTGEAGHGLKMEYWDPSAGTAGGWIEGSPKGTNAGNYAIQYLVRESPNYKALQADLPVTIKKAIPEYTAPTAKTDLIYNGQAQKVLSDGISEIPGVSFEYAYDRADFDDETKTHKQNNLVQTEPGISRVWYKVVSENPNYESVGPRGVYVGIDRLRITAPKTEDLTYNGKAQNLLKERAGTNSKDANVQIWYKVGENGTSTSEIPTETGTQEDVTEYTVYYWAANSALDNERISDVKSVKVNILPVGVTAPKALDPVYNGKAQDLISAGSTESGTMQYSLNSTEENAFGTAIPQGTDAGTATVYYRVVKDDVVIVGPVPLEVHILKADIAPRVSMDGWTYGQDAKAPVVTGNTGIVKPEEVTFSYSGKAFDGTKYGPSADAPENAGEYTVTATIPSKGSYKGAEASDSFTISKAASGVTVKGVNTTYSGEAQNLVTVINPYEQKGVKVLFKTRLGDDYVEAVPTAKNAGRYTVWAEVRGGNNYTSSNWLVDLLPDASAVINKADFDEKDPKVTIKGWTYGGYSSLENEPEVKRVPKYYDGNITYLYAEFDPVEEEYGSFKEMTKGELKALEVGTYGVKARASGTNNFNGKDSEPAKFTVSKESFDAAVEIQGWTYGEYDADFNWPEVTNNPEDADVTFEYAKAKVGAAYTDEDYSEDIPVDAGSYVVRAKIDESVNYDAKTTDPTPFTVAQADISPSVFVPGWVYGTYSASVNKPYLFGNPEDNAGATVKYYYAPYDPTLMTPEEVPAENYKSWNSQELKALSVGHYVIKAIVEETKNYKNADDIYAFRIYKADAETIAPEKNTDLEYTGNPQPLLKDGTGSSVNGHYEYFVNDKKPSLNDSRFKEERPTGENAGEYTVWYKFVGNGGYESSKTVEGPIKVTIDQKDASVEFKDLKLKYKGKAQDLVKPTVTGGTIEYRRSVLSLYSTKVPQETNAGSYTVYYRVNGDNNHKDISGKVTVTIDKADITPQVKIAGWVYGQYSASKNSPSVDPDSNPGKGTVKYEYKPANGYYTSEVPRIGDVGTYMVRATVGETSNYYGATATQEFSISPAMAVATVRYNEDLVYNGKSQKLVAYDIALGGTIQYSLDGVSYSPNKPEATKAGDYTVSYVLIGDKNHQGDLTPKTKLVTVAKAPIRPSIDLGDWTYGDTAREPVVTGNTGNGTETISYYKRGTNGGLVPLNGVPVEAGRYVVGVSIAESDNYQAGTAYDDFAIRKAALKVVANDNEITYGDEASDDGVRVTGLKNGDLAAQIGTFSFKYGEYKGFIFKKFNEYEPGDPAGEYLIVPSLDEKGEKADNYDIDLDNGTLTVGRRHLTVEWPDDNSFTYAAEPYDYEPIITGFYDNDESGFSISIDGMTETDAGEYTAEITDIEGVTTGLDDSYEWIGEPMSGDWEITKASLTAKANSKTIVYGDKPSANGIKYTGFEGDDDESILDGTADFNFGGYHQYDPAGNYEITVSGLESENYDITYAPGTLKVEKMPLTVIWSGDMAVAYDGEEHSVSAALTGLTPRDEENELVWIELSGDTTATAEGNYTAKAVLAGKSYGASGFVPDNYFIANGTDTCNWKIVSEYDPAADEAARAEAEAEAAFLGIYSSDVPKAKSVKVKAGKKSFKVSWKKLSSKQRKKFTRQEIQYCKDGKFNRKTTTVKERRKSKTSYKVNGLKKGSTYYVRVRNIKYVYDKKYVSKWSKVKKIKIK